MRKRFILLPLYLIIIGKASGQNYPQGTNMPAPSAFSSSRPSEGMAYSLDQVAAGSYTELKYTICFANQVQMAYNGMNLKQYINESMAEVGDLAFYSGHYVNAAARYSYAFQYMSKEDDRITSFSLIKLAMQVKIPDKLSDKEMHIYSSLVNTSGITYQTRGRYADAEKLFARAMSWRAQRFGKTSREYINSLHNMAVIKKDLGQYEESERMFNYLVPTMKKLYTEESIQYVVTLNNKAMLLAELGRLKEAGELLEEALRLGKTVLDRKYIDYERILCNRALIEQQSGNLPAALSFFKEAVTGMENKGLDDHPDFNNLMIYYGAAKISNHDPDAGNYLDEMVRKANRRYGNKHPILASAISTRGDFYFDKGDYSSAAEDYGSSLDIFQKALGERNRQYLVTLIKKANCNWKLGRREAAADEFGEAIRQYLYLVHYFFPSMSETEKAGFYSTCKPGIESYMSFVAENGESKPSLIKDLFNLRMETKGILINATRQVRNNIMNKADAETVELYKEWIGLKNTILSYYSSPLEDQKDDKVNLSDLEKQANEAEKQLSKRSARFSDVFSGKQLGYDDLRAGLQPGDAAMEIVRINNPFDRNNGTVAYVGLIARKDAVYPEMAKISNGKDLEEKSIKLYRSYIKYSKDKDKADDKAYRAFWEPFDKKIGQCKSLLLSVDGVYNNVSIGTLSRPDGTYLIDAYPIYQASNPRDLAMTHAFHGPPSSKDSMPLLIGSPDFGNEQAVPPLPGTLKEVDGIQQLLKQRNVRAQVLTGSEAKTENLENISSPIFLHIATHGFFNPTVSSDNAMSMGIRITKAKENPLLRSGLLLSGAASVIRHEPSLGEKPNGILYAYHVMNFDLSSTELVVLSACETGLGEVVNGEGVYGLSRAFQVAGAGNIIMSLWKVDDEATQELMTAFYREWLQTGLTREAFHHAIQAVRKKYPSPFYWGAFVMIN